jgi:hypothetical protein
MTKKIQRVFGLGVLLSLMLMLAQCATVCREPLTPLPEQKTGKMVSEIVSIEEVADKAPDPSVRAKADLDLAKLYSSYKNPRPDYEQALRRLEMYLSFYPVEGAKDEMRNWVLLLQGLVKGREEIGKSAQTINQLTKENEELASEGKKQAKENKEVIRNNKELARENEELARDNKELRDTVRALKNIDIKMEEKRKQIK